MGVPEIDCIIMSTASLAIFLGLAKHMESAMGTGSCEEEGRFGVSVSHYFLYTLYDLFLMTEYKEGLRWSNFQRSAGKTLPTRQSLHAL